MIRLDILTLFMIELLTLLGFSAVRVRFSSFQGLFEVVVNNSYS